MSDPTPTTLSPPAAGELLRTSLKSPGAPHTIADAAAESGLALRDAERGMHWLTEQYRGHLRVTREGDLLFVFPHGFTRPWETRDAIDRGLRAVGRVAAGALRFVVRAWLTIVLLGYVAVFVAILVGLLFARSDSNSSSRRSESSVTGLGALVFRLLADAFFWTFHPFAYGYGYGYERPAYQGRQAPRTRDWRRQDAPDDETPFYEKVNRFFFGPPPAAEDPRAMERRILAEIRAQKGVVGLADVMRVTGLPRAAADPLMARLMLDYDGDVAVSEGGGITYRFESLRRTGLDASPAAARGGRPAWAPPREMPAFTGNTGGFDALMVALNGFNLVMSLYALHAGLTVSHLVQMFHGVPPDKLGYDGVPVALGIVPLVFSAALFLLPLGRALLRPLKAREVARENGRLGLVREVLTRVAAGDPLTPEALATGWTRAAGTAPAPAELTRVVVDLGGDIDIQESGDVRYRFADLETEAAAATAERENVSDEAARVGPVVFASDR